MTTNSPAGRDYFLSAAKRRFKEVPLPDGTTVRIRSITAGEWAESDAKNYDRKNGGFSLKGLRESELRLVVLSVVDVEGNPVFTEGDIPQLADIDAGLILPLFAAIKEHSRFKQNVEDAIKNSEATGEGSSLSSSSGQQGQPVSTG